MSSPQITRRHHYQASQTQNHEEPQEGKHAGFVTCLAILMLIYTVRRQRSCVTTCVVIASTVTREETLNDPNHELRREA